MGVGVAVSVGRGVSVGNGVDVSVGVAGGEVLLGVTGTPCGDDTGSGVAGGVQAVSVIVNAKTTLRINFEFMVRLYIQEKGAGKVPCLLAIEIPDPNIQAGDRRHPDTLPYRCCLSALAGFGRLRRAGPARTGASILEEREAVNSFGLTASI